MKKSPDFLCWNAPSSTSDCNKQPKRKSMKILHCNLSNMNSTRMIMLKNCVRQSLRKKKNHHRTFGQTVLKYFTGPNKFSPVQNSKRKYKILKPNQNKPRTNGPILPVSTSDQLDFHLFCPTVRCF